MTDTARRKIDLVIIWICGALTLLTMFLNTQSDVARLLRRGERVTGLLIGSDYEDYARHSDTMMLVSYDPQSRFLDIMSIPRDTMISNPQFPSVRRVNEMFAYEFRHSGRDFNIASMAFKGLIETLLSSGTAKAFSIPYYFTIDYRGFRNLIDAVGGVFVRVTEPMHYDDNWGKLHIHFEPGVYRMNGKQALEYVRFRGGSADQGRVRRQQIFVKEVLKRFQNPMLLLRAPRYAGVVLAGFHTNMSPWDLFSVLLEGRRLRWSNLRLISLPGTISGNLWKINPENTQRVVAMLQAPAPRHRSGAPTEARPAAAAQWRGRPTVEVWNASSRPNAARAVMRELRQKGFDVVRFGNFSSRQYQTLAIDRSGDLRPAQSVAQALDGSTVEVVSRPEPGLQVDVSVIIGNDYQFKDVKWKL
jgi:polyisoprenyl-teichoic acid--peptidoglycan teichoic acid transferase